jgi:hypothetical protein
MTRPRLFASSVLAFALILSACGTGGAAAFSVGDEDFSNDQLNAEVDDILARPAFFVTVFGFCPTAPDPSSFDPTLEVCPEVSADPPGTYSQAVASFAIRQRIFFAEMKQELDARGLSPSAEDEDFVNNAFAQPGPDGRSFFDLMVTSDASADEAFVSGLLDDFTAQVALQNLFTDEAAFNDFVIDANQRVEVNQRYGTWDPSVGSLEPPEGASSPPGVVGFPT